MALRYLVPALAIASRAAALCSGSVTIRSAADAEALATCQTYSGSISIATGTTDDIALDGIRRITGNLVAKNVPHMASLSADSLSQIDDSFGLDNIQTLTSLNFPMLTAVDTVDWVGLPNLQGLSFTASLQQASALSIQNTGLTSLDGINLQIIDTLILANNLYLDTISMQLGSVGSALALEANGRNLVVEFPNLLWANNMTLRNCSTISIPSLNTVNGSLGFYSNYFDTLSAPNLTQIGQTFAIISNGGLSNVSLPELKTVVGGFVIANNTQLKTIGPFAKLKQIGGNIDFFGTFNSASLPSLTLVRGAFDVESTENIESSCNKFHVLEQNGDIRGKYTCMGGTSNPGKGANTGSSGSGSGSGKSGASTLLISSAAGVIGVVAAFFTML